MYHQDIIRQLEDELDTMDRSDARDPSIVPLMNNRMLDDARADAPRKKLFGKILAELEIYGIFPWTRVPR